MKTRKAATYIQACTWAAAHDYRRTMKRTLHYLAKRVDALWSAWVESACTCDAGLDSDPKAHRADCYVRMQLCERRRDEKVIARVLGPPA